MSNTAHIDQNTCRKLFRVRCAPRAAIRSERLPPVVDVHPWHRWSTCGVDANDRVGPDTGGKNGAVPEERSGWSGFRSSCAGLPRDFCWLNSVTRAWSGVWGGARGGPGVSSRPLQPGRCDASCRIRNMEKNQNKLPHWWGLQGIDEAA